MTESEHGGGRETGNAPETRKPKPLGIRILRRIVVFCVVFYVLWCATLYFYQDHLIFPKDLAPAPVAEGHPPFEEAERWTLDLPGGGETYAWYVPNTWRRISGRPPAVIYFHGNAELADFQDDVVASYMSMGFVVLVPEYRGYGRADGEPTEAGLVHDGLTFYDMLKEQPDIDPTRIVVHGRSVGGGVAAQVAGQRDPAALILQCTFRSMTGMAGRYAAPGFLVRHPFRTDDVLERFDAPVLLGHGTRDEIIPVSHGRALSKIASGCKYIEYDCGHNDFPGADNAIEWWEEVEGFLHTHGIVENLSGP